MLACLCFKVGDGLVQPEALNKKAIQIINRVRDKLTGGFWTQNRPKLDDHSLVFPQHAAVQQNHLKALKCPSPNLATHVEFMFSGRDFSHDDTLDVPTQVELLIKQATSHENLCQCYIGWSVFSDQTDIMMTANTGSFPHLSCFSHKPFIRISLIDQQVIQGRG